MKLTTKLTVTLTMICVLALAFAATTFAAEVTIDAVLEHYDAVREALVTDTVERTMASAQAIEDAVATLHHPFDAQAAGVSTENQEQALDLLGTMHLAAAALTQATESGDLDATRNAFYELTKPLVQYRELMTGTKPVVAYCPMAKKSWLQKGEEIGNPYAGQSMPTCGSVVSNGR